ncbi:4a-hydroxytetrahydrobiopterin dehydratase [Gammaproteobacteria bacterium]|nr:4a-hydroxytetrahydrobiopterin dehydratase [bacterium]MDC3362296.1 4a-hydroxytetrahydrobiopterin dehydratase [Gammaproteobacteria bacterium]
MKLHLRHCEPCKLGTPVISEEEAHQLVLGVPGWKRQFHGGVEKLVREFFFISFKDAFTFTAKVANAADREDHHPTVLTEWGKVTVYWWSHRVDGLHVNDFIMAAKTDTIARLAMNSESHDSPTENQVDEHAN